MQKEGETGEEGGKWGLIYLQRPTMFRDLTNVFSRVQSTEAAYSSTITYHLVLCILCAREN